MSNQVTPLPRKKIVPKKAAPEGEGTSTETAADALADSTAKTNPASGSGSGSRTGRRTREREVTVNYRTTQSRKRWLDDTTARFRRELKEEFPGYTFRKEALVNAVLEHIAAIDETELRAVVTAYVRTQLRR